MDLELDWCPASINSLLSLPLWVAGALNCSSGCCGGWSPNTDFHACLRSTVTHETISPDFDK